MPLNFQPPLLNSASPWATTKADLVSLYDCPFTGAVTVRTSLLLGWNHDDSIHQYTFLESKTGRPRSANTREADTSLNTLGYSPISIHEYLEIIESIAGTHSPASAKPFIISVTGTPEEIGECYKLVQKCAAKIGQRLLMEVNLSCPNITNKPPPAYSKEALEEYLSMLSNVHSTPQDCLLEVGIKAPPFTHHKEFENVVAALLTSTKISGRCPITYIASTNTLGNCLVMDENASAPALASETGEGIGGLGGAAIHALSLGNVQKFRKLLDAHEELRQLEIIGIGGVLDHTAYRRMIKAGAGAVALATGLGLHGTGIFKLILHGV